MERISALEEEVTLLREALAQQQLPSPIPRTESAVSVHASAAPERPQQRHPEPERLNVERAVGL